MYIVFGSCLCFGTLLEIALMITLFAAIIFLSVFIMRCISPDLCFSFLLPLLILCYYIMPIAFL